jgi:tellurite resistance protein
MSKRYTRPNAVIAALTTNFLGHSDEEVMQALVTAGAVVALADGWIAAVERAELVNYLDRQGLVPTMSRDDIAEAFDNRARQLEDRDSAEVIVTAFRPLAGLSLASVVVHTAERVAAADCQIHPGELGALKLIRLFLLTLPTGARPCR